MQNQKIILFITFLFFNFHCIIYGQSKDIKFDHISTKQGLSHNTIHCILQDSYGFIWIGTEDGLNRYDGYEFKIYRHNILDTLSIADNFIYSVIEDEDKQLWIGTNVGGLDKFDRKNDIFIHHKHDLKNKYSISDNRINQVNEDNEGDLWLATDHGLNKFDKIKGHFTCYIHDKSDTNSISDNQILTIFEDKQNVLWIGTNNGGLNKFDKKTKIFSHYLHDPDNPNSISSNTIISIAEDNNGFLWIGTNQGLNKFSPVNKVFTRYQPDLHDANSLSNRSVSGILINQFNEIWIGTANGLNIFNSESENFSRYYHSESDERSLSANVIFSLIKDKSGIIWLGTAEGGLNKYNTDQKQFLHIKHDPNNANSLDYNVVRYLYEDNNGIIWIGTLRGLNKFDITNKQFTHYDFQDGVTSVLIDKRNELWIGTWQKGLFRVPPINTNNKNSEFNWNEMKQYQHYPDNPLSIGSNTVQHIYEDSFGNFWIGTEAGLNILNRNNDEFILLYHDPDNNESISDNRIQTHCIVEDKQHNLWVGTWNGLNRLSLNKTITSENNTFRFTRLIHEPDNINSLSDNRVISILSNNNELWIGTYGGGLNKMVIEYGTSGKESYHFVYYTEKDGLPNNSIYGILQDDINNLWLSTNKGLSKFNIKTVMFRNYFESDGLQNDQFFWGASLKLSTGEMLFGGINGFNMFYPDSISDNLFKPPVVITDFQIFNESVMIGKEYKGHIILNKPIYETNKLELTYKHKVISFEFASLDYSNPKNNKYAYKMEGFEENWNFVDKRRFVSYTNLPSGNYNFQIKATNSDGILYDSLTSINIIVNPPFWNTAWFIILEIITVLILIIVYIRLRERKLKKDKKILNRKVIERTNEIEQQKDAIKKQKNILLRQNKEITDSIIYAKRIQNALFPPEELFEQYFKNYFIINIPRDIVSGDFYWIKKVSNYTIIAVADCTGHGIPGAFMSMLGIAFLNEIIRYKDITSASEVLNELRKQIKNSLHQQGKEGETDDGMDIALCAIDYDKMQMQFAGAFNPLYMYRNNELTIIKGDKMPIGIYIDEKESFTNHEIKIEKNDCFYLFSDGYIDQFGSDDDVRFTSSRFKKLLSEIHQKSLSEQNEILKKNLLQWKVNREQVDDITVVGFRI